MESEKKNKKKRRIRYSILFVPDAATADIKKFMLSHKVLQGIVVTVGIVLGAILIYGFYLSNHMVVANTSIQVLQNQVNSLQKEKNELETANKELTEKVSILSDTVNDQVEAQKSQEEALAEKCNPTGFPLKGTASYTEGETTEDGYPIVIFTAGVGTDVIATANGEVKEVLGDDTNGYCIVIDHGNEYLSYYYDLSSPLVKQGDEVTRSTVLYQIQAGGENLGYQISYQGEYMNPLDLMEIYG